MTASQPIKSGKEIVRAMLCLAALASFSCLAASYEKSDIIPPKPLREFRGVWVATVANIDWPSKPGLATAEQKKELLALLDRAVQLKLNAIIFQVRPACDAMYASKIEPWSEYLTGAMGKAPRPFYDPLAFAVEEAHKRGLELHAWFNPYRAHHYKSWSPISASHISRTRPNLVRPYGKYLWLDPGERDVQDYSLSVVMDVVKRYDIDGVQFDDYFYPDPAEAQGRDFPDESSWKRFGAGGNLSRQDWRRKNVSGFVHRVYLSIKDAKPWVKFGISPPGVWRPGFPKQIKGMDTYAQLYADSRMWFAKGWLDYFAPQLYWPIDPKEQSFPALLDWWANQNASGRNLWPGMAVYKANEWKPDEIPNQIRLVRRQHSASGYILYNMTSLLNNAGLAQKLEREINVEPVLTPAVPNANAPPPSPPTVFMSGSSAKDLRVVCRSTNSLSAVWVIQTKLKEEWDFKIIPGRKIVKYFRGIVPDAIAVTEIDRYGNAGRPVAFENRK